MPPDGIAGTITLDAFSRTGELNWTNHIVGGTSVASASFNAQNQNNSLGYDSNGNQTTDASGRTLVYDAWNQLVAVNFGGTAIAGFAYDAMGRRASETEGGATTNLYYSTGWQVLEERQGGSMTAQNVWSPMYVDALTQRTVVSGGTTVYWAQHDDNFNTTSLTSNSGTVMASFVYDPYGTVYVLSNNTALSTGALFDTTRYLHQGLRFDSTTATYDSRNRIYDPTNGTWKQQDPAGYVDGGSLYEFVRNSPADSTDSLGLWERKDNGNRRATWESQKGLTTNTLAQLAKDVELSAEPEELKHWLRGSAVRFNGKTDPVAINNLTADNISKDIVCPGQQFTVPNVFIEAQLLGPQQEWSGLFKLSGDVGKGVTLPGLRARGKKIVEVVRFGELRDAVDENRGDIWGMEIYGHGGKTGALGNNKTPEIPEWDTGNQKDIINELKEQKFRMAKIRAMQCDSFSMGTYGGGPIDWLAEWNKVALDAGLKGFYGNNEAGVDKGEPAPGQKKL